MDQFHSPSFRQPRRSKHRKAPNEPSLSQSVEKKIASWNPAVPDSENIEFGFGGKNFNVGSFVFGKNSTSCGESSNANGSDRSKSFDANVNVKSVGEGLPIESDEGFLFTKILDEMNKMDLTDTSGGKQHENFDKLPHDTRQINTKSYDVDDSVKSKENSSKPVKAASGQSSVDIHESMFSKLPDELRKMNLQNTSNADDVENFGSNNYSAGVFVFGSGVKSSSNFSSSVDSDESFLSELNDDMSNINMADNKYENSFVRGSGTGGLNPDPASNSCCLPDSISVSATNRKSDSAPFSFGSGMKKNTTSSFLDKSDVDSIPSSPMFSFTSKPPLIDFKTPSTKETLFTGVHQSKPFSPKMSDVKSMKTKKKHDKSRQSIPLYQNISMQFVPERSNAWINVDVDSNGSLSSMDCSPCHDNTNPYSRETLVASEDADRKLGSCNESEEMLVSEAQKLNISVDAASLDDEEENMAFYNESRASMDSFSSARVPSSCSPLPNLSPHTTASVYDSVAGNSNIFFHSVDEIKKDKTQEFSAKHEEESSSLNNDTVTARTLCEKWRFRGNNAYSNGHLSKAEDYYTSGINSVCSEEIPSSCVQPLILCYSNRATTRMSLGKIREALHDSKMALSMDPNFMKARIRIANCHLALGEIVEASNHFNECLKSEKEFSSHQNYLTEASEGLKKAQVDTQCQRLPYSSARTSQISRPSWYYSRLFGLWGWSISARSLSLTLCEEAGARTCALQITNRLVADLADQSAKLLLNKTYSDASKALDMIREALSTSPHSESLMQMEAEALLVMRNYNEIIKLCEGTVDLSEKYSDPSSENFSSPAKLWRSHMIAKSYFYLGKLEEALELLEKHEKSRAACDRDLESSNSFVFTVRELLRLKSAGNEAFQAGRHSEAVEFYTSAVMFNAESRPFTAVCFCNRAAAFQSLGQISDAIADCSLAIALDSSYAKAISRKATLHEMIRDYGQAAKELNRLIVFLQTQIGEMDIGSKGAGKSSSVITEIKRAQSRLVSIEEEDRKKIPLDMYMILGIEQSCSAADIKKAYRKAALRHHPDKIGQSLARNENIDDGMWREVVSEVHADADRLFKLIGEAYTTLSDSSKRLRYDEETRTVTARSSTATSPRYSSDTYSNYHPDKSFRHQW